MGTTTVHSHMQFSLNSHIIHSDHQNGKCLVWRLQRKLNHAFASCSATYVKVINPYLFNVKLNLTALSVVPQPMLNSNRHITL